MITVKSKTFKQKPNTPGHKSDLTFITNEFFIAQEHQSWKLLIKKYS